MKEFALKYGCNPHQKPARIYVEEGELPLAVLNGRPGYINFLDALNSWQLVKELKDAMGMPAAASFKHVSPAGAALGLPLSDVLQKSCFVDDIEGLNDSPLACAYARARGTDRMSSFGDWIALSDICDETTANIIKREVSDGVIAPGYTDEAKKILSSKRNGNYNIVEIDPEYEPPAIEHKQVFGVTFEQGRNDCRIDYSLLDNIVTKSILLSFGTKADLWHLRQHPKVMELVFAADLKRQDYNNTIDLYLSDDAEEVIGDNVWQKYFAVRPEPFTREEKKAYLSTLKGVSLGSDAFFPFSDNIERAAASGVSFIAQPGGSIRDDAVIECCDKFNMVMAFTGLRLFHH